MKIFIVYILSMALILCFMQSSLASEHSDITAKSEMILYNFENPDDLDEWRIVNDGVMGGLSQSIITLTENKTAVFQGTVSLENNGGFSSTRTSPRLYNLTDNMGIAVHFRGDGKSYQLRLRTDDRFDGVSYRYHFKTKSNEWTTISVAFEEFVPVFRGRVLKDVEPIVPGKIQQVGFLISDKQAGPFRLEVDWIKAYRNDSDLVEDSNTS